MAVKQAGFNYSTASNDPNASYWNTFNPFSQALNWTDRVPKNLASWLPIGDADTRYMVFKLGSVGLMTAAIVGGLRLLQHNDKVNDLRKTDAPGSGLKEQLNSTFDVDQDTPVKTEDSEEPHKPLNRKRAFDLHTFFGTALPASVALLTAALTYTGVDAWADKEKGQVLSNRVKGKSDYLKKLMVARARNASDQLTTAEFNNALSHPDFEEYGEMTKKAWGFDNAASALGLLAVAMVTATGIGSYLYFSANNPRNIKYKAYKKGLEEYAMTRSQSNPLTIGTADSDLFKQIDKVTKGSTKKNQAPVAALPNTTKVPDLMLDDKHTPVSITL